MTRKRTRKGIDETGLSGPSAQSLSTQAGERRLLVEDPFADMPEAYGHKLVPGHGWVKLEGS